MRYFGDGYWLKTISDNAVLDRGMWIEWVRIHGSDSDFIHFDPPLYLEAGMYSYHDLFKLWEKQQQKKQPISPRRALLEHSIELIDGDRNVAYGDPNADFKRIAQIWNAYLSGLIEKRQSQGKSLENLIEPHDVSQFMIGVKMSRISWSPEREDHWADEGGYAGCGWDCASNTFGLQNSNSEDTLSDTQDGTGL